MFIWHNVQHQDMGIALQAQQRPALHAVADPAAMAAIVVTNRVRTRIRLPHRQGAAGAAADQAVAQEGRAGREQAHPWCTRLLR